jgi:hypothetical protein
MIALEGDCYPSSPIYCETLAHYTRAVYPPRFFRTASRRWTSVFLWLWLDHIYVSSIGFHMHGPRSPIYGETLARHGLPPRFFKVLLHVCEQGDHTSDIALPHLSTLVMAT